MWEKSNGPKEEDRELYPQARVSPRTRREAAGDEHLLFVQLLLCAAVLAFVFFSRTVDAPYMGDLREQYTRMLSQGVEFSTENTMVRLASRTVEGLRVGARELLKELEVRGARESAAQASSGQGGIWPVKRRQVPDGVSLEDYALSQTLLLPVAGIVTSPYGFRDHPISGEDDFHAGVDIAAAQNTPVACALEGQVVKTAWNSQRGNYILVRHADGVQTLYQHLSCIFLRAGERVEQGQILGAVGSTGVSTGPHLHFELILNGVRVDPAPSLPGLAS